MTSYADECRLRAQYLLEAADGVEFQLMQPLGEWVNIYNPDFSCELSRYRRKPKKVRHERIFVWIQWDSGGISSHQFVSVEEVQCFLNVDKGAKELKRETLFVEVEE